MANYPISLDDADSLYNVENLATSPLATDLLSGALTITVTNGSSFPLGRQIVTVEGELILCSGRVGNDLTVEERGAFGTADVLHNTGVDVFGNFTAEHYEEIRDTVIVMQEALQHFRAPVIDVAFSTPLGQIPQPTIGDTFGVNSAIGGIPQAAAADAWLGQDGTIAVYTGPVNGNWETDPAEWTFIPVNEGTITFSTGTISGDLKLALRVFNNWFGLNDLSADQISFNNTTTGYVGTDVQAAIDEMFGDKLGKDGDTLIQHTEFIVNLGSVSGAVTIDWTQGNVYYAELTGATTIDFSNVTAGRSITLILQQDVAGGHSVSWIANVDWNQGTVPTINQGVGEITDICFRDFSGGANPVLGNPIGGPYS